MVRADVPHIVYALADNVVHACQTVATNLYVRRHLRTDDGGVLAAASIAIFARYAPQALAYMQSGGTPPAADPVNR